MYENKKTLYNIAKEEMQSQIKVYLNLIEITNNFENLSVESISSREEITILLAGKGSYLDPHTTTAEEVIVEWERRQALPFDLEAGITKGIYSKLREVAEQYFCDFSEATDSFTEFNAKFIHENPFYLPILQHVGGVFSKSKLKKLVGPVTDNNVSLKAAKRLANYLNDRVDPKEIHKSEVLSRLGATLEGIVRDLVGKILLESIVANALELEGIAFKRESEYEHLEGVVYDFRADFVLPDAQNPQVFIEVRKSSSRHASLYAKDKMFSAINWKGKNKNLLGVLVVDGPWTSSTLDVMTRVFDYVIPIYRVPNLVKIISAYLQGDSSKLKWIIDFKISINK
ncbi:MAG: hypothetical protein PVF58_07935 [Candidatus Methanofastidiosia archaeon]|jgi:hypothetical protein